MPNTINIVQPKAEDGTPVSYVTRTNSIFKSDGSPLGDSLDAYMDEVDELSQNLAELITTTTITQTTTASGNITLPISSDNKVLLNANATNSRLAIPWENSGVYTIKILKADLSIAASESVTVRYSYKSI